MHRMRSSTVLFVCVTLLLPFCGCSSFLGIRNINWMRPVGRFIGRKMNQIVNRSPAAAEEPYIYEFSRSGATSNTRTLLAKLEQETNAKVKRCNIDSNKDYARAYFQLSSAFGNYLSTPMYYNRRTKSVLFGPTDYPNLKAWALGDPNYERFPRTSFHPIRHNSFYQRALRIAGPFVLDRYYLSKIPPALDPLIGPLLAIISRNWDFDQYGRSVVSVRQLNRHTRFSSNIPQFLLAVKRDLIETSKRALPSRQVGAGPNEKPLGKALHSINNEIWNALQRLSKKLK